MYIKKVSRYEHKCAAEEWFRFARSGNAPGCFAYMHEHLRLGGLTLADIGKTKSDVRVILRAYYRRKALKQIKAAGGYITALLDISPRSNKLKVGNLTLVTSLRAKTR